MKRKLKILLIEDNRSDAELLIRHLEKANYQINSLRVETKDELTNALKDPNWDLVCSDYSLPELNAVTALKIFKEHNLDIPFILISGAIGEEAAVEMIKAGAQNYVMKSNLQKIPAIVEHELKDAEDRRERIKEEALIKAEQEKVLEAARMSSFGEVTNSFFKSNLEYLLEANNIKQSQLSRDTNISKQTISDWLNKDSMISIQQAFKLTKYFHISVDDLFTKKFSAAKESDSFQFENFNSFKSGFQVLDLDSPHSYVNQGFAHLIGFNEYELNTRPIEEMIHPEDLKHFLFIKQKIIQDKAVNIQVDLRYITAKHGYQWINNHCFASHVDRKIFIFSCPIQWQPIIDFSIDRFSIEKTIMDEIDFLKKNMNYKKDLCFINEMDPKDWIITDKNIFKCLIRSLYQQFQIVEFESHLKCEVTLKTRYEHDKKIISASINCAINPFRPDISRVNKIAHLIGAEFTENYAGNLYSLYISFNSPG